MILIRLSVVAALFLSGCSTTENVSQIASSRSPTALDGQVGDAGESGASGQSGSVNADYWYSKTPLKSHYHYAIPGEDLKKIKEWIEAGFSAHDRATARHPTAIQQALSYRSVKIVKMLTENPKVSARPDPRKWIQLCAGKNGEMAINFYEFIVYGQAVDDYLQDCDPEIFESSRKESDHNIYIRQETLQMFLLIAQNDKSKSDFAVETARILNAVKASQFTVQKVKANLALLGFIENQIRK